MKRLCAITFVIVVSLFIIARQPASAAGWGSRVTTITGFYLWDSGNAHFRVANMENPDGCVNPGYLTLDFNAPHFKEQYATLMSAYTSGRTVQLYYRGCNSGGYPLIGAIAVPNVW